MINKGIKEEFDFYEAEEEFKDYADIEAEQEEQLFTDSLIKYKNHPIVNAWDNLADCVILHLIDENYSHDDFLDEIHKRGLDKYFSYTELFKDFESIDDIWKKIEDEWEFTCKFCEHHPLENPFVWFKDTLLRCRTHFAKYLLGFDEFDEYNKLFEFCEPDDFFIVHQKTGFVITLLEIRNDLLEY